MPNFKFSGTGKESLLPSPSIKKQQQMEPVQETTPQTSPLRETERHLKESIKGKIIMFMIFEFNFQILHLHGRANHFSIRWLRSI